ncbi:MAG: hypothetical protein HDQ98_12020 [Lachnospiraceae bacterium]|nr:hypothetical protein [Lachnospiraceae bacterium]
MKEVKIELKDYFTILNLHKALLEAKFHENPDNENVASSPIIADLCNKLVDALTRMDEEKNKQNIGKWDNWRMLKNQTFYKDRAIKNAVMNGRWKRMSEDEKIKATINMLSPFIATEEEVKCFIKEVDETLGISK